MSLIRLFAIVLILCGGFVAAEPSEELSAHEVNLKAVNLKIAKAKLEALKTFAANEIFSPELLQDAIADTLGMRGLAEQRAEIENRLENFKKVLRRDDPQILNLQGKLKQIDETMAELQEQMIEAVRIGIQRKGIGQAIKEEENYIRALEDSLKTLRTPVADSPRNVVVMGPDVDPAKVVAAMNRPNAIDPAVQNAQDALNAQLADRYLAAKDTVSFKRVFAKLSVAKKKTVLERMLTAYPMTTEPAVSLEEIEELIDRIGDSQE